jgi:hypothetical protein
VPGLGFCDSTLPTWLRFLAFFFVTFPSAQLAAFSNLRAKLSGSPLSAGTTHWVTGTV